MRFWADEECLLNAACTTLHWQVDDAEAVYLNGEGVPAYGDTLACPPGATGEYTLVAVRGTQRVERSITLSKPTASMSVDNPSINAGQCTVVRWDVEGVEQVFFNGEGVAGHGQREVCPSSTTRYDLHVITACGNTDRSVTVQVASTAPPPPPIIVDGAPPNIGSIETFPAGDTLCERSRIDVQTVITDDSGVARAELWVLFIPYGGIGAWDYVPMDRDGNIFFATLNDLGLGEVRMYVKAWDEVGNASESPKRVVIITLC